MLKQSSFLSLLLLSIALPIPSWAKPDAKLTPAQRCERFVDGVENGRDLMLKRPNGEQVKIPSHNLYDNPQIAEIVDVFRKRHPSKQAEINKALTEFHADHEMSFNVKNEKTGKYDKIFKVPVNGTIIPMSEETYQRITKGMEPVLRAMRSLAQRVMSVKELTPESLGLTHLSKQDQKRLINTIKDSIYYDPQMSDPRNKDFPFFFLVGFDLAHDGTYTPKLVAYEYNSGTPSGFSNNAHLMEAICAVDLELCEKIRPYLRPDNSFADFKAKLDSIGKKWTGRSDGISVAIGPGPWNGAHPDVSSIAEFSGIPLVRTTDLYVDANGDLRLNRGPGKKHPVVTTVYSRMEESYFFANEKDGIHWMIPELVDNPELGKKWGVTLKRGVAYDFIYNDKGERIGVNKDANGQPKIAKVFNDIGRDPARPNAEPGSFWQAHVNKKFAFSGLGGRWIDNKVLFEIVSGVLAKGFVNGDAVEGDWIRPPRTLRAPKNLEELAQQKASGKVPADSYQNYFDNPRAFVVKPPDMSGGSGVAIGPILSDEEVLENMEKVREDIRKGEFRLSIQELASQALYVVPKDEKWTTTTGDIRVPGGLDADGNVWSMRNGFLVRLAGVGKAHSNTSKGGEYGVAAVLANEADLSKAPQGSLLPKPHNEKPLPISLRTDAIAYLQTLSLIEHNLKFDDTDISALLKLAPDQHRAAMAAFGYSFYPMMTLFREASDGSISRAEFKQRFDRYLLTLRSLRSFPYEDIAALLRETPHYYGQGATKVARMKRYEQLQVLPMREVIVSTLNDYMNQQVNVVERSEYIGSSDPELTKLLNSIREAGVQVREIRKRYAYRGALQVDSPASYFRVDERGQAIIGIDLTQDAAIPGLAHEFSLAKSWMKKRDQLMEQGHEIRRASLIARDLLQEPSQRMTAEKAAVEAEMNAEKEATAGSLFNAPLSWRAEDISNPSYIARLLYPEASALREHLRRAKNSVPSFYHYNRPQREMNEFEYAAMRRLMDSVLAKTVKLRKESYKAARDENSKKTLMNASLWSLAFPDWSTNEFLSDGTWGMLKKEFDEAVGRATMTNQNFFVSLLDELKADQQRGIE